MSGRRNVAGAVDSGRNDTPATEPSPPPTPRRKPLARRTWQAVNEAERLICAASVVESASAAEGLALTGHRAARRLAEPGTMAERSAPSAVAAPWVDHRTRGDEPAFPGAHAFELVASSPQEAVDLCLVAHELAARLGRPGLCTIDRSIADSPALIRMPGPDEISRLSPVGHSSDAPPAPGELLQVAEQVFETVSGLTGRGLSAVRTHRVADASYLLVADGALAETAERLADALSAAGTRCGAVVPTLTLPLPSRELRGWIESADEVAVLATPDSATGRGEGLAALLGAAFADRLSVVGNSGGDLRGWLEALGRVWNRDLSNVEPLPVATSASGDGTKSVTLGAVPSGPWMEELLLDSVAWLGMLGPVELAATVDEETAGTRLQLGPADATRDAAIDLLVVGHVDALDSTRLLEQVREGGTLVLHARADSPASVWNSLSPDQQTVIKHRRLSLLWTAEPGAHRTEIEGAILSALAPLAGKKGTNGNPFEELESLSDLGPDEEAAWPRLRSGASSLTKIDIEAIEISARSAEKRFSETSDLPRLPAAPASEPDDECRRRLHQFHLTGVGEFSETDPLPALPLRPSILEAVRAGEESRFDFPLILLDGDDVERFGGRAVSLRAAIEQSIAKRAESGQPYALFPRHVRRFRGLTLRTLEGLDEAADFATSLGDALAALSGSVELSEAGVADFAEDLDRLRSDLPSDARILGPGPDALLPLYAWVVLGDRRERRGRAAAEIATLIARLEEVLKVEEGHLPGASSAQSLSTTLGASGSQFLDPAALAANLPKREGSKQMPAARFERIQGTLEVLRGFRERFSRMPEMFVIRPSSAGQARRVEGQRVVVHDDGMRAAIGLFDGIAREAVEIVRAIRTARLEAEGAYDEAVHDPILARLEWQALHADELFLLPPIVVLETGRRLRGPALAAFSELLRSGRPVHVLVGERASVRRSAETWEELAGYHPGLGYLAVAHREAFVLQATLARAGQLVEGLGRLAKSLGPSVALVALPDSEVPFPHLLQLETALLARMTPCFAYDPSGGVTWAERFTLEGNPQLGESTPSFESRYLDADGEERTSVEKYTFAHAAAINPIYRPHFRVIGPESWLDDQVEIGAYLDLPDRERARSIPYVPVIDDDGSLARAVMTREIVFGCLDRTRAWRILQELAGTDNEYANRAAADARKKTLNEAAEKIEELERAHNEALSTAREDGAAEAIERLVQVLTDPGAMAEALPGGAPIPAATAAPAAAPAEPVEAEPDAAEEEEDDLLIEEAYIDSMLCTTCNDCINLNPQMFVYNADKQAQIADVDAGTFDQLVRAAEICPARCIHPGVPRPGDSTVNEDLIARAAKFA